MYTQILLLIRKQRNVIIIDVNASKYMELSNVGM
jgi:hypothetical protein